MRRRSATSSSSRSSSRRRSSAGGLVQRRRTADRLSLAPSSGAGALVASWWAACCWRWPSRAPRPGREVAGAAWAVRCVGWGGLLAGASTRWSLAAAAASPPAAAVAGGTKFLVAGALAWLAGWGLIAAGHPARPGVRARGRARRPARRCTRGWRATGTSTGARWAPTAAASSSRSWLLILLQTFLSSGVARSELGAAHGRRAVAAATGAFAISLIVACARGLRRPASSGASRAQRLAMPEATIGVIYLGLPVPILLTLMERVPGAAADARLPAARGDVRGGPARPPGAGVLARLRACWC